MRLLLKKAVAGDQRTAESGEVRCRVAGLPGRAPRIAEEGSESDRGAWLCVRRHRRWRSASSTKVTRNSSVSTPARCRRKQRARSSREPIWCSISAASISTTSIRHLIPPTLTSTRFITVGLNDVRIGDELIAGVRLGDMFWKRSQNCDQPTAPISCHAGAGAAGNRRAIRQNHDGGALSPLRRFLSPRRYGRSRNRQFEPWACFR